jgi:hypothetical protein
MSSQSFRSFKYNLIDVDRLRQSHLILSNGAQGKKGLGHITRSGVVMLCAAWEHYCESLLREASRYMCQQITTPHELPKNVQKEISKVVRESNHELKPLYLSGDGWKQVYQEHTNNLTNALNTPKSGKLNDLFKRLIGIDDFSSNWSLEDHELDDFVTARGDIAHQGRHADYVTIIQLSEYRDKLRQFAVETDNAVALYLKTATKKNYKPWNITT